MPDEQRSPDRVTVAVSKEQFFARVDNLLVEGTECIPSLPHLDTTSLRSMDDITLHEKLAAFISLIRPT